MIAKYKIVHIVCLDKFIPAFIEFIENYFGSDHHLFIVVGKNGDFCINKNAANIIDLTTIKNKIIKRVFLFFALFYQLSMANKIIIHGLWDRWFIYFLFFNQILLKKCYWVIWGGDLYDYYDRDNDSEGGLFGFFRRTVIRKIGHFITYIKGDYELAKEWYGCKGQYHECLMYPSNLYKEHEVQSKNKTTINILVGNSATDTNNHFEVFEKLEFYKDHDILIYCPLSYGDSEYANRVVEKGLATFSNKFIPLFDFMSMDKYVELLSDIDIAVFAHKRQQGMGNTITLLGLGKKVYMRKDVTQWQFFKDSGIKVFDFDKLNLDLVGLGYKQRNRKIIKNKFSIESLVDQYSNIFE